MTEDRSHAGGPPGEGTGPTTTRTPVRLHEVWTAPPSCTFPVCNHVEHVKQEWESTADALPQLVCLLDAAGAVVRCNRTVERWGLGDVVEAQGRCLHALMHPHCAAPGCYLRRFLDEVCGSTAHGAAARCQAEDPALGRYLDIQVHAPGHGGAGQEGYAVAVVADISELKAAEAGLQALTRELERRITARTAQLDAANRQLRQEVVEREQAQADLGRSRDRYLQLVETMNEGLAVQDRDGRLAYVNERFARMLGCGAGEVLGRPATDFVDPDCLADWQERMAHRGRGDQTPYELVLRGQGGERVWAKVSPKAILDPSGEYAGSFAVVTDISERVRAEQALRASECELRLLSAQVISAQEKERQRIASELHDGLGQILSAIKFSVENTLAQLREHPAAAGPQPFQDIVPKLQGAIEEVRRISMDLRPSILDDLGVLATLGWFCREYQAVYQGIRVELDAGAREADIPVPLKVVIFRIVQEALNNVAKHARTDTVRIGLQKTSRGIELEISDNGVGFDPAEIAARRGHGLGGTGLVSMRERAECSGGRFAIASTRGEGTVIRIHWPASQEADS